MPVCIVGAGADLRAAVGRRRARRRPQPSRPAHRRRHPRGRSRRRPGRRRSGRGAAASRRWAARDEAEELAEQIALLEYADTARSAWFAHTAVTRDNAERARFELRARGVDIDHPADLTTAEEWLAAHRAQQAERLRDAEITEDEVIDDVAAEGFAPAASEELAEVAPPDIRDTAVPNAADAEREATEAADREAAEAARREELLRWADTPTTERDQAIDGDDLADDVLTREG